MRFERKRASASEVNPGALTDIMFFLLLFFVIMSTVANPNVIKLLLPKSSQSSEVAKKTLSVSINKNLEYYLGNEQVDRQKLYDIVKEKASKMQEPVIICRIEEGVPVEYLVDVLDVGMRLKLKVVLETRRR